MQILKRLTARFVVVGPTDKRYAYTERGVLEQMRACPDPSVEVFELIGGYPAVIPIAGRSMPPNPWDRVPDFEWIEA
ncbi:hypothetical protein CAL26_05025 [Bordetella genomosp. 9]|uniref:Uncharacterized protein n=1 Tax=Bordetella genomosp. 9 TaxID=1416803 RepID=A0A261RNR0_9BORD|nr:hypothetical protein [Bordetella genomosp. 9]OZI26686.1 hypothetical protein CAL26_05025 [Bordetella genomosp. 9]